MGVGALVTGIESEGPCVAVALDGQIACTASLMLAISLDDGFLFRFGVEALAADFLFGMTDNF